MIGKKMALRHISSESGKREKIAIPKSSEENHHDNRKDTNADGFGFLEALNQAVQECGNPKKPLKQSGQHTTTNDGYVYNLQAVSSVLQCMHQCVLCTHILGRPGIRDVDYAILVGRAGEDAHVFPRHIFVRGMRWSGDAIQEVLTQVGHRGERAVGGSRRAQDVRGEVVYTIDAAGSRQVVM